MALKEFSLEGKAAVVIGAEHAVGRAAAIALAEAGAKVLLASQQPGTEKQLKDAAKAMGPSGAKVSIRVQTAALRGDRCPGTLADDPFKRCGHADAVLGVSLC